MADVVWPTLCARIEHLLSGQADLLEAACPAALDTEAQRIAAQLLARAPAPSTAVAPKDEWQCVAVASLALLRPLSVGVEAMGLWALQQLGVPALLVRLGLTGPQQAAALGSIIGRLAAPGSERATHAWLGQRSALGELLGVDFEAMSTMQLYRASDALLAHGETAGWSTLRRILAGQQRVTATFRCADQRTLHVRKATRPEAQQQALYAALGLDENPGGTQKTVV